MAYIEFPQNNHFVIIQIEGGSIPVLSEKGLEILKDSFENVREIEGWGFFPWGVKQELVKADVLNILRRVHLGPPPTPKGEAHKYYDYCVSVEEEAWEVIQFLSSEVHDVYPFRDNIPD